MMHYAETRVALINYMESLQNLAHLNGISLILNHNLNFTLSFVDRSLGGLNTDHPTKAKTYSWAQRLLIENLRDCLPMRFSHRQ